MAASAQALEAALEQRSLHRGGPCICDPNAIQGPLKDGRELNLLLVRQYPHALAVVRRWRCEERGSDGGRWHPGGLEGVRS